MKRAILIGLIAGFASCGAFSNARAREKTIVDLYTAALVELKALRDDGKIDDQTWVTVKTAVRAAKGARRAVKEARERGDTDAVGVLLDAMMRAMANVIAFRDSYREGS